MKKNTCTDFSILIPVRIDSIERLENIQLVVHSILKSNTFDIKVYECSSHYNGILHQLIGSDVEYTYIEDCDPIFYRTHYINLMTNDIKTKFIAVWDADILINPIQLHQALELLRSDKADLLYHMKNRH